MTNKEVIERLHLMQERCCNGYDAEAINLAIKALEKRLTGEWIPVSERLPDLYEVVLVTDECGNVFEYERRLLDEEGNVCEEWSFLGRNITAWMPLPEAYKEGGAE